MNTETALRAALELVAAAIDGWFDARPTPAACTAAESRIIVAACWRLYELTPNRTRRAWLVELAHEHFVRLAFDDLDDDGPSLFDVPDNTTPGHEDCPICNPGEASAPTHWEDRIPTSTGERIVRGFSPAVVNGPRLRGGVES